MYHKECFVCFKCKEAFKDSKFLKEDDKNMCGSCANQLSKFCCFKCEKKIVGKVFQAMNQDWHPECFRCKECGKQIISNFKNIDNQPDHNECKSNLCACCHLTCQGEYFQVDNGDYIHKDCLTGYKTLQASKLINTHSKESINIQEYNHHQKYTLQ